MSCEPGCNHHHHLPQTGFGSWRPSEQDHLLNEVAYDQIHEVLNQAELGAGDPLNKPAENLGKLIPLTRSLVEQLATVVVALEDHSRRVKQQLKENESLKASLIEMRLRIAQKPRR